VLAWALRSAKRHGAALDWMLEPNGLLSTPESLEAIPKMLLCSREVKEFVKRVEGDRGEVSQSRKCVTAERIVDLPANHSDIARFLAHPYSFKELGPIWVFRYTDDDGTEEDIIPHLDGFTDIRRLMQNNKKPMSVFAVAGLRENEKKMTFDPILGKRGLNETEDRFCELMEKRKAVDLSTAEWNELNELDAFLRSTLGLKDLQPDTLREKKKVRGVEDKDTKNARNNARNRIGLAKQAIKTRMRRFRKYLDDTIIFDKGSWRYTDPKPPDWYF
jgi:hypothetical protein